MSHRLGGFDGVSVEAAKWISAFRALGAQVTRAAGHFVDHEPGDVVVRGLWADRPGGDPPAVDHDTIRTLCRTHDLLVLDNAGSLWSAPEASLAWQEHALAAGIPTVLRHHDPAWQGTALRPVDEHVVPLHHPAHLHVLINHRTAREFTERHPALARAGALRVLHNRIDVDGLARGDRDGTRARLGAGARDTLVVHPARVEGLNKNIPGAVRFTRELAAKLDNPVRHWLTDDSPANGPVAEALRHAPGLVRGRVADPADLYAAADLVVLPSTWEGWGLPVTEAAAAGRLVVAGPYPVLDEIRALGLTVLDPGEVPRIADLLTGGPVPLLAANRAAVRRHLDARDLPRELTEVVTHARALATGR
ncbi:glycosyltransferase involved in cell wall biosynthesis [Amycolatopsis endophytica]|uniref:Glycosyltransferase involved in cell wall biosynthesis n=1 Tax=Amycolatopsis endophytica TaxID=860233 RepID=A0A853AZG2_9PSEU|nr:glycosyltransferase [Amycolatopsis endophytica]NYI88007.1 glycosyltransferase involved in cell wall biosynthesis [Amycolatopsis endophytica]